MGDDVDGTDGGLIVATETFLTQPNAIRFLEDLFSAHGAAENRNLVYLLNDQRRGRVREPIPFLKLKGRILYRAADLEAWALAEIERERTTHSGVFEIEGDTELERLLKLATSLTTH